MSKQKTKIYLERLKQCLNIPDNNECFDCTNRYPKWASINLGLFLCIDCAGVHRSLGTHISKVRSISMDEWDEDSVVTMERIGNRIGKLLYCCSNKEFTNPIERLDRNCSTSVREKNISLKYVTKRNYALNYDILREEIVNGLRPNITNQCNEINIPETNKPVITTPISTKIANNTNLFPSNAGLQTNKPVITTPISTKIANNTNLFSSNMEAQISMSKATNTKGLNKEVTPMTCLFNKISTPVSTPEESKKDKLSTDKPKDLLNILDAFNSNATANGVKSNGYDPFKSIKPF